VVSPKIPARPEALVVTVATVIEPEIDEIAVIIPPRALMLSIIVVYQE
jgi:hypothetical protein